MPFRLATWPSPSEFSRTPYLDAFYRAMEAHHVIPVAGVTPTDEWLRANGENIDGIHIHWPDGLWRRHTKAYTKRLGKAMELRRFLRLAHRRGVKIIWTVHNLARHEGANWLDRYCYSVLAARCDLFICHSQWAAEAVRATYAPAGRIAVMPIGSFPGLFPNPRARDVVLQELQLRVDRPLVCALGNIRLYKGLEVACDAVRQLNGAVQLVIGGKPYGRAVDIAKLRKSLTDAGAGLILDRALTNQEFADIVAASEAVVLPYGKITGSAALMTAWTLGRGVIASDLPYFREIASIDPDAAQLFPAGNAEGLRKAIVSYLQVPAYQRNQAARRIAAHYAWERCVEPVAEAFEQWRTSERHAS